MDVEQAKTKENREVLWDTFLFRPIAFLCLYGIIKVKSIAGQRVNKPLFISWQSFMWVIQILQQNPMKSLVETFFPPPNNNKSRTSLWGILQKSAELNQKALVGFSVSS